MKIATARLVLRPIDAQDVDGYAELLADPRVHPYIVENGPRPADEIPERIALEQQQHAERVGLTWAILREGVFIGYVAIHAWGHPRVAMSYAIRVAEQGRGFGREAVRGVLDHASELGFDEVEARTHLDNEASARLLLAAGFVEGEPWESPARRIFVWTKID